MSSTMLTNPSQGENSDSEALDPRLSYLLSSHHSSVADLLNASVVEIVPLPPPVTTNLSTSNSNASIAVDQGFVVKDNAIACERTSNRFLFLKNSCCCAPPTIRPTNHTDQVCGWDDNHITEISPTSHFVIPATKSEACGHKDGPLVTKSSSTSKIEVPGKYNKGYPYEKSIIPFYFEHLEGDVVAGYAELYRESHTYPSMEKRLSNSDYTSYSAPSVIEPKLLVLGISKPGVTDPYRPYHQRQYHKSYTTHPANTTVSVKDKTSSTHETTSVSPPRTLHSLDDCTSKSTSILEVFHGQSTSHKLSDLPHPASPDSPPSTHQASSQKQMGKDCQTSSKVHVQFKDILNVDDTQCLKSQNRPSVKWASHNFPANLVPSTKQGAPLLQPTTDSQGHRRQQIPSYNKVQTHKTKIASFARARNSQVLRNHITGDLHGLSDLSATSFSKPAPKMKDASSKSLQNENRLTRVRRDGDPHTVSHDHLPVAQGIRRNRKSKQTSSLTLMPTSKALVPSLGIYSRTSLTQKSTGYL